ncbi:MAG: DUF134 domain-containing protein [Candidatus Thermoplasmatota archaeon]|nr:DUF134 domain-containing protein [Candidatus Thermoplasmatota archaeon]
MRIRLGRPKKERNLAVAPKAEKFSPDCAPAGIVRISADELEALRLADLEKLTQEECAEKMGISRRTYWNTLKNAREKIAGALIFGKEIRIGGAD